LRGGGRIKEKISHFQLQLTCGGSTWPLSRTAAFRYSTIVEKKKAGKAKDFYGFDFALYYVERQNNSNKIESLRQR
jgi:hypothetical protein